MNKEGWKLQLKEMERLLGVAKNNVESAQKQVDELEYNVLCYKKKIQTFK